MVQAKRNANDLKERVDLLRAKLRKQAMEAQKLVDRANETGDIKQAVEMQEKNVKVFAFLGINPSEMRGSNSRTALGPKRNSTESFGKASKQGNRQ